MNYLSIAYNLIASHTGHYCHNMLVTVKFYITIKGEISVDVLATPKENGLQVRNLISIGSYNSNICDMFVNFKFPCLFQTHKESTL